MANRNSASPGQKVQSTAIADHGSLWSISLFFWCIFGCDLDSSTQLKKLHWVEHQRHHRSKQQCKVFVASKRYRLVLQW